MAKTKKVKIVSETPVDVVEVVEPVVEVVEPTLSEAKQLLKKIFAIQKAQNPELYALKNKDADLERKLKAL